MEALNFSPMLTPLIVDLLPCVSSNQLGALEPIQEEPRLSPALELCPSPRMSTKDTLRPFVSGAKMRLEVQSNMTIGRSSRPEIVEQLWMEPIRQ
jgi:hypothetical protein